MAAAVVGGDRASGGRQVMLGETMCAAAGMLVVGRYAYMAAERRNSSRGAMRGNVRAAAEHSFTMG